MSQLVQLVRRRAFQPIWECLHRMSLVGMNYWSSEFSVTGERDALAHVAGRLSGVPSPVVFDVGANLGDYSRACVEMFNGRCRLYAFEPADETFGRLSANPALSGESVSFHCLALSDREGVSVLHSSEPCSSIASLEELDRPIRPFDKELDEVVAVGTIDSFCLEQDIARIDLLKLDIEGHEISALRGAKRMLGERRIRFVQFEFGENNVSSGTYLADFVKLLADQFDFYRIVPGGLVPWRYDGGRSEVFATMNYLCELKPGVPS